MPGSHEPHEITHLPGPTGAPMTSVYTPEGAFRYLLVLLGVLLVAAMVYLALFGNASFIL